MEPVRGGNGARNVRYNGASHIGILELADEYIEG